MAQPSLWKRCLYWRDYCYSLVVLVIARLLPTLKAEPVDLYGKVAIVTGTNSGIGLQLAIDLASQGATVYLACRNNSRAEQAVNAMLQRVPDAKSRIAALQLDTSSLDSVRRFAEKWPTTGRKHIDILCNNAGVANISGGLNFSVDGFELAYATNFLGSFLLTNLLESYLSPTARVVFTSSTANLLSGFSDDFALGPLKGVCEPGFHCPVHDILSYRTVRNNAESRYANTKAMQVVFARLLQRRFDHNASVDGDRPGRTAHAFAPGFTMTPIFEKMGNTTFRGDPLFATLKATLALSTHVSQGTMTGTWLATTDNRSVIREGNGGGYWDRMTRRLTIGDMSSNKLLDRLWTRWERDAGIEWH